MNLFYAIMLIYAAVYRLHKAAYESYDCVTAIQFIFEGDFKRNMDKLDFD